MSEYIQTTIFGQGSRIQTEDMGDVYRNRYSKAWNGIIVAGSSHADFSNIGDDANDVFCKLVPFWQLELYWDGLLCNSRTKADSIRMFMSMPVIKIIQA